ncbi:MAG TPA: EscU/YscU/HrcU family type III secretion system export apparatus switch protein [Jatrophihabitans sp.]
MAGGGGGGGEKTEKATPRKLKKARSDGNIGNTPELGAWFGLLIATFLLPGVFKSLMDVAEQSFLQVGTIIQTPDTGRAMAMTMTSLRDGMLKVLPLALVMGGVAIVGVAAQGGIHPAPKLLKPKFSRMNPLSGIKRMFGPHGLWQLAKSLFKTIALGVVVWLSVKGLVPTLYGSGSMPLSSIIAVGVSTALNVLRASAVVGVLLSFADFAVVRRRNQKSLKMTKEEVKEEFKSSEGDPHTKSARRSRALAMARNRMMKDVPTADVVLVNPTHVAVALKYEPTKGAPRVVAKGADNIAAKIREIAEANRVPMVRDVPLARTLYQSVEIGQEVPPDLYKAVATVLAFIMTLKRRGSAAGTHEVRPLVPAR